MARIINGALVALVLVVTSVAVSGAASTPTASCSWRGQDADKVAYGGPKADGKPDGHFTLVLDLGSSSKTINQMQVFKEVGQLVWDLREREAPEPERRGDQHRRDGQGHVRALRRRAQPARRRDRVR